MIYGDGKYVVSAPPDRTIRVWDIKYQEEKVLLKESDGRVKEVAISPDGIM